MTFLLSAWLLVSVADIPIVNDPELVQDVTDSDEPIVAPEDNVDAKDWKTRTVQPKDVSPTKAAPSVELQPDAPTIGVTVHSNSPQTAPPAPVKEKPAKKGPSITGYHVGTWNDSKFSIQKQFAEDRPLLERGGGKWMLQDTCESENASVTFRFTSDDRLNQVVCQFRQGVESSNPDYPMYQKIRKVLTQRWGDPTSTNESPAPDSPSQASEWAGDSSRAVLIFDLESNALQLTVDHLP
jgi:hypothetical protein